MTPAEVADRLRDAMEMGSSNALFAPAYPVPGHPAMRPDTGCMEFVSHTPVPFSKLFFLSFHQTLRCCFLMLSAGILQPGFVFRDSRAPLPEDAAKCVAYRAADELQNSDGGNRSGLAPDDDREEVAMDTRGLP